MENKKLLTAVAVAIGTVVVGTTSYFMGSSVKAEPTRLEIIQAELGALKSDLADCQTKRQELEDLQRIEKEKADGIRADISKLEQEAQSILGLE